MRSVRNLTPDWVHSGAGALSVLHKTLSAQQACNVFVMSTSSLSQQVHAIEDTLGDRHLATYTQCKQHSPANTVEDAVALANGADAIISFGGGSVIDTAKAVASRVGHPPQIAIPTTLSAGEFTPGMGITDTQARIKNVSVDLNALPRVVIHDPEVARDTPRELWLSSGIKALDHALELLWWHDPHPRAVVTATDAAARLLTWLPKSADPAALEAREQCYLGAWMAIQSLFGAGARLSHPVGHQLGAYWGIPHGITSCVTLPASIRALKELTPAVDEVIAPLFGVSEGNAAAQRLEQILHDLKLPTRLSACNAQEADIPHVAQAIEREFQEMGRTCEIDITELLRSMW